MFPLPPVPRSARRCRGLRCLPILPLLLMGALAHPASARQVEREVRLPVDAVAGIVEITPELRDQLGLFPGVGGFRAARLLLRADGETLLEIEFMERGELVRQRRPLSPGELEGLRDDLASRLGGAPSQVAVSREGRGGFVLGHTLLGLGYHGWAVPVVLDLDSARGQVAAYLLTSGATFYAAYRLSRERAMSEAHRDLAFHGGTRGILAGILVGDALVDRESDHADRVRVGSGLVASVAGSATGLLMADRFRPDEGRAALWTAMGDLGLAAGAAAGYAAGPYASRTVVRSENGWEYEETERRNRSAGHLFTLGGGVAGFAAGGWMGSRRGWTEGNVSVLRSSAVLGAQLGATLTRAATEDDRAIAGGAVIGGLGGIVASDPLLRGRSFTSGEGLLVNAAHLAGGATALGLTWLAVEEIDDRPVLYLATSTAGSLLGAGLVYRALGPGGEARDVGGNGSGGPGPGARAGASGGIAGGALPGRGARLELGATGGTIRW